MLRQAAGRILNTSATAKTFQSDADLDGHDGDGHADHDDHHDKDEQNIPKSRPESPASILKNTSRYGTQSMFD